QLGIAVAVAGHQGADLRAAGGFGPGAEHGPALEVLAIRIAVQRVEVVPVEDDVHAEVFGRFGGTPDGGVISVLRLDLNSYPNGPVGHVPSLGGTFRMRAVLVRS